MSRSARFDNAFLLEQVDRRKGWKAKGVKAGHGGDFNIDSIVNEMNRTVNSVSCGTKHIVPAPPSVPLFDTSDVPNWMVQAMQDDSEVAFSAMNKKVDEKQVPSPHKRRVGQGIKSAEERNKSTLKEHWLQVRLFYNLERSYPAEYAITLSVPNGGLRSSRSAALMVYEGQKKGAPDIFMMCPKGIYHGLLLEVKTEDGRASKEQKAFHELLKAQGYLVVVRNGFDACWSLICEYISLPNFDGKTMIHESV